jgi:hypothetical protein
MPSLRRWSGRGSAPEVEPTMVLEVVELAHGKGAPKVAQGPPLNNYVFGKGVF